MEKEKDQVRLLKRWYVRLSVALLGIGSFLTAMFWGESLFVFWALMALFFMAVAVLWHLRVWKAVIFVTSSLAIGWVFTCMPDAYQMPVSASLVIVCLPFHRQLKSWLLK